jgi:hypothetical protein
MTTTTLAPRCREREPSTPSGVEGNPEVSEPIPDILHGESAFRDRLPVAERSLGRKCVAEVVEKVQKANIIVILIICSNFYQNRITTNTTHLTDYCANIESPDFFNSFSHKETLKPNV